jgi:hypothetical protein
MEVYSWENHLRDLSASHVGLPEGMHHSASFCPKNLVSKFDASPSRPSFRRFVVSSVPFQRTDVTVRLQGVQNSL